MPQIVASTIDADKIDYLLRDLLRTGALRLEALQELTDGTGCYQLHGLPDFTQLIYKSQVSGCQPLRSMTESATVFSVQRSQVLLSSPRLSCGRDATVLRCWWTLLASGTQCLASIQSGWYEPTVGQSQCVCRLMHLLSCAPPSLQILNGRICFSKSTQPLLQLLLRVRRLMHEHAYQKPEVKGFELMLAQTLQKIVHYLKLDWLLQHGSIGQADFDQEKRL